MKGNILERKKTADRAVFPFEPPSAVCFHRFHVDGQPNCDWSWSCVVIELNETNVIWEWDLSLLDNQRINCA